VTTGEQAEAVPVLIIHLRRAHRATSRAAVYDFDRDTIGGVPEFRDSPVPDRHRRARLMLLAVGLAVAILASLAMWVFHGQLGVEPVAAARVAAIMAFGALAIFLWGLHRVIITSVEKVPDLHPLFRHDAPPIDEFFQSLSAQQSRLSATLLILIHMGWIMPMTGVLVAILGQTGALRLTGLATGSSLGALTVFIRSTVLPVHRENGKMLQELLNKSVLKPKKAK
jgi:hypothetical protein